MQNRDIATTLLKGLGVLRAYRDADTDLTQAELAKRTGYDRATVRRLCLTLVEAGFASQTDRGFRLSPRVLTLAGTFLRGNEIGFTVQPILNAQARDLGCEISLAVRDDDQALYVAQSHDPAARISFGLTVGSTLPLLATAIGRMLLACLPPDARDPIINRAPLQRHTVATCLDRDAIRAQVERIAHAQVAVVREEYETDICGIAVPIGETGGNPVVLGTALPQTSTDFEARQAEIIAALRVTASQLKPLHALRHW